MEGHNEVIPRKFLCCKLCDEEFRQPKYLPCLHSFCKNCLMEYVQRTSTDDGYFNCPVCKTESNVRQKGLEDLPDNVFARRLSCPVVPMLVREKMCRNCQYNDKVTESVSHCVNCDDFLCEKCAEAHLEQQETASHKIQPVKDYDSKAKSDQSNGNDMSDVLSKCCDLYDPLDIGAMFCVDCDMALCSDCHTSNHVDHRCAELSAIAENFVIKIKEPLAELANDSKILTKNLHELEKSEKIVAKNQLELQKLVKQRTKVLCNFIQEYENVLISEIDKRHLDSRKRIKKKKSEIQMHLASLTAVTELTEKLVTFGSDEEKVSMRRKIGRRVRELCEDPLPDEACYEPICLQLSEQKMSVEKICDMFGELTDREITPRFTKRLVNSQVSSLDSRESRPGSTSEYTEDNLTEITELDEGSDLDKDSDMLSASNHSDVFYSMKSQPEEIPTVEEVPDESADNSFHSSFHDDVPCQNLDNPTKEIMLPSNIQKECIKGIGVNSIGDIVIGTVSPGSHTIHVMEKRGIIRGQSTVEPGWNLHSVASDGKVSLMSTKGDNRYKIKVLSNDGTGTPISDVQFETFGLNYFTSNSLGHVIATSNRYGQRSVSQGKAAKSGGNVAMYNTDGVMIKRITNDDFQDLDLYLLEKPCCTCVDKDNNFFVTDPGSHVVCGFTSDGKLLFEYGNTDTEEEFYVGPDAVCTDKDGNVIVTDKREGRLDVLNHEGQLLKCLFTTDNIKFASTTPDKLLMVATCEGSIKFYDYL
ncbi:E3 ubiquitin-protein ligase TRIM56 isoform X2 [Patella vulgata]|nr:E3 ubiquitin-protein ligase TRIM56 isoform X2 [Patella vulgata]